VSCKPLTQGAVKPVSPNLTCLLNVVSVSLIIALRWVDAQSNSKR
jgi:hypothetical protein